MDIRIYNKNNSYEENNEFYNKQKNQLVINRKMRVANDFEEYTRFDV
jgi:hypothetical protein